MRPWEDSHLEFLQGAIFLGQREGTSLVGTETESHCNRGQDWLLTKTYFSSQSWHTVKLFSTLP